MKKLASLGTAILLGAVGCNGSTSAESDAFPSPADADHLATIQARIAHADGTLDATGALVGVRAYGLGFDFASAAECNPMAMQFSGTCACRDQGSADLRRDDHDEGGTSSFDLHACGGAEGSEWQYVHHAPGVQPADKPDPSFAVAADLDLTAQAVHYRVQRYVSKSDGDRFAVAVADGWVTFELKADEPQTTFAVTDRSGVWTCQRSGPSMITCTRPNSAAIVSAW